jgi:hypothetical protein
MLGWQCLLGIKKAASRKPNYTNFDRIVHRHWAFGSPYRLFYLLQHRDSSGTRFLCKQWVVFVVQLFYNHHLNYHITDNRISNYLSSANSDPALVSTRYQPYECSEITLKDQYGHHDIPNSDGDSGPTQTDLGRRWPRSIERGVYPDGPSRGWIRLELGRERLTPTKSDADWRWTYKIKRAGLPRWGKCKMSTLSNHRRHLCLRVTWCTYK